MTALLAVVAGVVFALGLAISDMTSPSRVVGFLDVTGAWDGTLAFVMAGAIGVLMPFARKLSLANAPAQSAIDTRLVVGSAIFGVGWGLSGYCPGPALVSIGSSIDTGLFVAAVIAGIAIARRLSR